MPPSLNLLHPIRMQDTHENQYGRKMNYMWVWTHTGGLIIDWYRSVKWCLFTIWKLINLVRNICVDERQRILQTRWLDVGSSIFLVRTSENHKSCGNLYVIITITCWLLITTRINTGAPSLAGLIPVMADTSNTTHCTVSNKLADLISKWASHE